MYEIPQGGISLEEAKPIENSPDANPWLVLEDQWQNYSDPDIYAMDKWVRAFIEALPSSVWFKCRFTPKMLWAKMYNKTYDNKTASKEDRIMFKALNRIMGHYATRRLEDTTIAMVKHKNVFILSKRLVREHPPYSLRLRIEKFTAEGKMPTFKNMKVAKPLKEGECRNPRTRAATEARSRRRKDAYNKYQLDRKYALMCNSTSDALSE